ncbi:MAG TPA: hypothetical protein EYP34_03255 [Chromatiaceae bacterium]|nr:hypothetical protein [Chromatiaceae bacterium]
MSRYWLTLFFGGLLLSSSAFAAGVGLGFGGISLPDGTFQSTAARPQLPPDTAWVALSGGDYTNPVDAMTHWSDWCGLGSTATRCTLLIAPGTYELLKDQQLVMHENVDIVGMGMESTQIVGRAGGTTSGEGSALILGASEATLRDLSVVNAGVDNAANVTGIYNKYSSFSIVRVKLTASFSGSNGTDNYGIVNEGANAVNVTFDDIKVWSIGNYAVGSKKCFGIWNKGYAKLEINHAEVQATGCNDDNTAIQNTEGTLRLVNVDAEAYFAGDFRAFAVWNTQGTITILDSTLNSTYRSLGIDSASDRIINTQLDGSVSDTFPSPSTQCRGTYDDNLTKVDC